MTKSDVKDLVEELEAEVNNGGFDQYFFNSSGDNASAAVEALRAIDANTTASILERAVQMFPGGYAPPDRWSGRKPQRAVLPLIGIGFDGQGAP